MLGSLHVLGLQTARSHLGNTQRRPDPTSWLPQVRQGVSFFFFKYFSLKSYGMQLHLVPGHVSDSVECLWSLLTPYYSTVED